MRREKLKSGCGVRNFKWEFFCFVGVMVRGEIWVCEVVGWVKGIVGVLNGRSRENKEYGLDESGVVE